ncbi:hypothetical protein KIPB_016700, partial [Kipferlia bialata]|eukprot:g16700.t1
MTKTLQKLGVSAVPLHGSMTQYERLGALARFKAGEAKILVATDVASRGLDIPCVDVVVNYDVPTNSKTYIHRVGRTARSNRTGLSVTLVTQYHIEFFQMIEKVIDVRMAKRDAPQAEVMALAATVLQAEGFAKVLQ